MVYSPRFWTGKRLIEDTRHVWVKDLPQPSENRIVMERHVDLVLFHTTGEVLRWISKIRSGQVNSKGSWMFIRVTEINARKRDVGTFEEPEKREPIVAFQKNHRKLHRFSHSFMNISYWPHTCTTHNISLCWSQRSRRQNANTPKIAPVIDEWASPVPTQQLTQ